MDQAGVELIAKGVAEYLNAMERAQGATDKYVQSAQDGGNRLSGSGGGLSMIGMAAANFIGTMTVQAFNAAKDAAIDFIGSTITTAADYESTMNRFGAVAGDAIADAGMELSEFSDLFLDMGAKTQFSAQQAAEAAVNLAKGGIDPATIAAGGLEGALALAAAGELDLAQAAEITAKTLGVWGDRGVDAAKAANLLSQAANASTVDVDDLAIGLANVGGTAKTAGVSFEDTVQAVALLAPGFSSASDAGTSLKTMISRFIPTTEKQTEAMVELGLATEDGKSAFFDAQGEFIGMREAAQKLQVATAGLTEEQKLSYLNMIFGQDAIRAAAMLAEAGAEGFDAMGASMAGAGTAAEQADKRNQGLNFALESLKGSWETIQIIVGTALLPVLTDLLNTAVIPLANTFLTFAQENAPALTGALEDAKTAAQPFIDTLTSVVDYLMKVGDGAKTTKDELQKIPEPFQPIAQAAGELKVAFDESMPMIVGYIEDMKRTATEAGEKVSAIMGDDLTSALTKAADFWREHGDEVMAIINLLWRFLVAIVGTGMIILGMIVNVGLTVLDGAFDAFEAARKGDWQTFWTEIDETADTAFDEILRGGANFIDLLITTFSGGTLELRNDWREKIEGLGTTFEQLQATINWKGAAFVQSLLEAIAIEVAKFVKVGENIVTGMMTGVMAKAGELARVAAEAALGALSSAKAALGIKSPSTAFEEQVGEESIEGAILGISGMAGKLASATADVFAGIPGVASRSMRGSGAGSVSYSYQNSRTYQLNLTTQQSTGSLIQDFGVMELMAG